MNQSILYAAIDVDDKSYHISYLHKSTGEIHTIKVRSSAGAVIKALKKVDPSLQSLKVCYESTYLGFSLCRELQKAGVTCEVIASSLIPELRGHKVKTDRVDSERLVVYYSRNLLTPVHLPDEYQEQVRDMVRSRSFMIGQAKGVKNHLLSLCRRLGWDYKSESGLKAASHWTNKHRIWLKQKIKNSKSDVLKFNLTQLLTHLNQLLEGIEYYDRRIEEIAQSLQYKEKVNSLKCFRGIKTTIAMSLISEIGDVNRFSHPSQLMSYCGLDIIEYSSGGVERKFNTSKMGNKFIRTNTVEACQMATRPPNIGRRLKEDRLNQPENVIEIADRCMKRLYKKSNNLKYRDKAPNKIKVACAREMLGFIWEALKNVS